MTANLRSCASEASAYLGYNFEPLLEGRFGENLLEASIESAVPQISNHLALKVDHHWNGFVRAILEMDRDCFASVRIHYWPNQNASDLPADIHSHAWDFLSFVIAGSLEISQFKEITGETFYRNIAATGKQPLGEIKEGLCGLEKESVVVVDKGSVHHAPAGSIHCVAPAKAPSLTLFFQGPHKSASSHFYSTTKRDVVHPVDLTPSELGVLAEQLKALLNSRK